MKGLARLWKKKNFYSLYKFLEELKYDYTIDNLEKDFDRVSSEDKFCYLIYLLSNDYSVKNTLLLCDFLIYTDTFFYDIHPVIHMFVRRALEMFPTEPTLLDWIVTTYENHPDSPFEKKEMIIFKKELNRLVDDNNIR